MRLTPSGGADRIDGSAMDTNGKRYLKARVRAPPEDGKANSALEALIANALGIAKSKVRVARRQTARMKLLEIADVGEGEVAAFLAHFPEN